MSPAEMRIRLGLFRKICDAVAYAHQKGVIHRDLKPGNVLIPKPVAGSSMPDAVPEIKVLDFGLARITDSDVQATTFITEMGKVQGRSLHVPRAVRATTDRIDLRTDVYALGVMLYEMVTGRLPTTFRRPRSPSGANHLRGAAAVADLDVFRARGVSTLTSRLDRENASRRNRRADISRAALGETFSAISPTSRSSRGLRAPRTSSASSSSGTRDRSRRPRRRLCCSPYSRAR
jgi:serine/threonine protein kinase